MEYFRDLYEKLQRDGTAYSSKPDYDPHHLDCLLNPCRHRAVLNMEKVRSNIPKLSAGKKTGHSQGENGLTDSTFAEKAQEYASKDIVSVLELLHDGTEPVYAMIAPAFISQFSSAVTPGKLRCIFKGMGFAGMIEVALFADILTLKEAFEFERHIHTDRDFLLTSCCCPIWIAMIRKKYHMFVPNIPPSVSPMVACGRSIKKICPDAKTIFIGPCMAKKAEAKEPDIKDAVDYVLTFQEIQSMFLTLGINPEVCEEDLRDHSSSTGRMYARVGGVSEAVKNTVSRIYPDRSIPLRAAQANGTAECRALLDDLQNGKITANFLEGMGCPGGCVGGPRRLIDVESGTTFVNTYSKDTLYKTPIDNPYVIELLHRLGFDTVDGLLEGEKFLTRKFN